MKDTLIERNRYFDSVTLMGIGEKVRKLPGVEYVEVKMGTPANLEILAELGFSASGATANDLVIAVSAEDQVWSTAMDTVKYQLEHRGDDAASYDSLDDIDLATDPYDLVQISLPGEVAFEQSRKALEMGLDVFIFSDNVPLSEERALKEYAKGRGLMVMGPDCGVGLVGGVTLAAGSIVAPGPIGIVAASGSGAQEVACIVERCHSGVSSILGTGGHDLQPEVGGLSMLEGLRRLRDCTDTQVVVLVSKLADEAVMARVLDAADQVEKPVVAVFLGAKEALFAGRKSRFAPSLEQAALLAVELCTGRKPAFGMEDEQIRSLVTRHLEVISDERKYLRGLYCGGTFTEEALLYLAAHHAAAELHSNLRSRYATSLPDPLASVGHTILDLGAEDFTSRAPHPIFDPAIRLGRFEQELADPEVAVVLLDFIAGPGVHPDPVTPFVDAYRRSAGEVAVVAAICGASGDPQNVRQKEAELRAAGIMVVDSNYQSARVASAFLDALGDRTPAHVTKPRAES